MKRASLLGLFIAVFASASSAQVLRYRLEVISPPDAKMFAGPGDIDNTGLISGSTTNTGADETVFIRNWRGRYVNAELLPGATFTGMNRLAAHRRVVGLSGTDPEHARAAMWDRRGRVTDVGVLPGATFGLANDRRHGRVVGTSGGANFVDAKAFSWKDGVISEVPIPGFAFASLESFGPPGSIAGIGWNIPFTDNEGFILHANGSVERAGHLPGGSISLLIDMNERGTAVGFADDGNGIQNAVYYENGQLRSVGTLPGHFAAEFRRVNFWGTAVGLSAGPPVGAVGVISRHGGPLEDINPMLDPVTGAGWFVFACGDINEWGQIMAGIGPLNGPPIPSLARLTPYIDWGDGGPSSTSQGTPPRIDSSVYERWMRFPRMLERRR